MTCAYLVQAIVVGMQLAPRRLLRHDDIVQCNSTGTRQCQCKRRVLWPLGAGCLKVHPHGASLLAALQLGDDAAIGMVALGACGGALVKGADHRCLLVAVAHQVLGAGGRLCWASHAYPERCICCTEVDSGSRVPKCKRLRLPQRVIVRCEGWLLVTHTCPASRECAASGTHYIPMPRHVLQT